MVVTFFVKKEYIFMIIQFKSISLATKMNILLINLIRQCNLLLT